MRNTLKQNHTKPGIALNGKISKGGYHPPKNKITVKELIKIIFAYSAKKNKTKDAEEYSVEKPATKVDSSSGKSNGNLFVSARAEIKKIINIGSKGIANQTVS